MNRIAAFFGFAQAKINFKNESLVGLTTFLAMAYITVVNPAIFAEAGMDFEAVFVATCLAAAFGSIAWGIFPSHRLLEWGKTRFLPMALFWEWGIRGRLR